MANVDHTARLCPALPVGHASRASPAADPPAAYHTSPSLRLSTLDDVAFALRALTLLCQEDERLRHTVRHPDVPPLRPLATYYRQGITVAMQCLAQYARQLGSGQVTSA
ncbi:hypothetical protein [Dyella telluris]|uniref:Uncharacterized protein n=1 Tax=Dyella telluris TaxID=2763498 RepID=A0A7G8Q3Z1_9GAMM|nr:hypothetical protein [Dyella telluris]QNK01499.1 hypothetical protein H8F01_21100 [Dyella telluris]